jgi:hypothetical protein
VRERERVKIQVTVQAPHANIGCMIAVAMPLFSYWIIQPRCTSTINEKAEISEENDA